MRLLISSAQLKREFVRLINQYQNYYWAVAWASCPSDVFTQLLQYQDRIKQINVGLHFYQTSPDFIKNFIDSEKVKFIPESQGVFHPKVFLFFNHENDWELIVGSANFTQAAFHDNTEVSALIGSNDSTADKIWSDIIGLLEEISETAKPMSEVSFQEYIEEYNSKKKNQQILANLAIKTANDIGSRVTEEGSDEILGQRGILRIRISTYTHSFNQKYRLYYDHINRKYSVKEYFGLYWEKSIRLVGKLSKIVCADLVNGQIVVVEQKPGEGEALTESEKERIKSAILEARTLYGDFVETKTRFFLVDEFFETDFEKKTGNPLRYHKLFDLKNYFPKESYPQNARDLADKLKTKTWEDTI